MAEFIDLTGSDEEPSQNQELLDDIQEIRVRRVQRPTPAEDDVVFVSSNAVERERQRQRQSFYTGPYPQQRQPPPHIPMFPNRGVRDTHHPQNRFSFSELGRLARTGYRPAAPRISPSLAHSLGFQPLHPRMRIIPFMQQLLAEDDDPNDSDYDDQRAFEDELNQARHMHPSIVHENALQQAMLRSMFDTTQREQIDPEKLKKPDMGGTSEGYTRDLNDSSKLLCAKCDGLLGEGTDKHALVYFRNCGHVYCGACVEVIGTLKGKNKKCSAVDCDSKKRQKIVFTQVYV